MSEENTENDKTKEEKDALSRMIENGQVLGINGDNKPIDFASHSQVFIESDNSGVLVDPHRVKMAISEVVKHDSVIESEETASIKVCKRIGTPEEGIFPEIHLNVKNESVITVHESDIGLQVGKDRAEGGNPSKIEIDDERILLKAGTETSVRLFNDEEGCLEIFVGRTRIMMSGKNENVTLGTANREIVIGEDSIQLRNINSSIEIHPSYIILDSPKIFATSKIIDRG